MIYTKTPTAVRIDAGNYALEIDKNNISVILAGEQVACLRPASAALIAAAGVSVLTVAILNLDLFASTGILTDLIRWKSLLLAAAVLVLTNFVKPTKKLHPIVFILASAVVGAVFGFAGV